MNINTSFRQKKISVSNIEAFKIITDELYFQIHKGLTNGFKTIVFLCIGTDRSTGDSLGPLIGYKLKDIEYENVYIHGCIDNPVHAKNISETMKLIYSQYPSPFVIAIDACLGHKEHIGYLIIGEGAIKPGAGVKKDLSPVGNIYITGVVNFSGIMDYLVLQNTRLSMVMKMAEKIALCIEYTLWKLDNDTYINKLG